MDLSGVVIACLVFFGALQFSILPLLRARWQLDLRAGRPLKAGVIAVIENLRSYALTALIVYATVWVLFLFLGGEPNARTDIDSLLVRIDTVTGFLKPFDSGWAKFVVIASFLALAVLGARRSGREMGERIRQEFRRLQLAKQTGSPEWQRDLPPTPEMREIATSIEEMTKLLAVRSIQDPESEIEIKKLKDSIIAQQGSLTTLDTLRRLNLESTTNDDGSTIFSKFQRALLSRGVLADMKGVGKIISHTSRVALCISLISIAAGPLGKSLALRQAEVEHLRVNGDLEEAKKAHSESLPTQEMPSREEVQKAISYSARRFEASVLSQPMWRSSSMALGHRAAYEEHADYVRVSVERQVHLGGEPHSDLALPAAADSGKTRDSIALAKYIDDLPNNGPRTPLGAAFEKYLQARATPAEKSHIVSVFKKHLMAYSEDADFIDLQGWVVGEAMGQAVEIATPEVEGEVGKQLSKSLSKFSEEFFRKYFEVQSEAYYTSLIKESTYESAASAVGSETQRLRGVPLARADLAPTLDRIQASEINLRTSLKKATADELGFAPSRRNDDINNLIAQMENRAAKTSKGGSPGDLESAKRGIDNSLHSYSDEFLTPDVATSSEEIAKADLATSFERLIPYSRVGGILIGRRARQGETVVQDLGWSLQGASIRLWLTDNHSQVHQLGTFPAILVQQALLYASDKRPVVVTVMRSPLLSRRQVLLHPALRDTPLGCRFVNDDHLIFNTLTPDGSNGEIAQELKRIGLQTAVYNSAVDVRKAAGSATVGSLTPEARESLRTLDVSKRDSPLTAVPEKFDQTLVSELKRCANINADVLACINSSTTIANGGLSRRSTQVVSQIQESDYDVHDDLAFVRTDVTHPSAWPLRMTIQMSIDNEKVYELSDLVPDVQTRVLKSIASEQQGELKELQDFALLQRLFRAGYDGTLSMSFPLDRLAQLASALKGFHPSWAQTPAWSIDGEPRNEIELAIVGIATKVKQAALISSPARVPERNAIANTMQKCIDTIKETDEPDLIANSVLRNACPIANYLRQGKITDAFDQLMDARELRALIGADIVTGKSSCAPVGNY